MLTRPSQTSIRKQMSKHVFPLILDGAVQAVTSSSDSWNGLTSYVTCTAGSAYTFTLAKNADEKLRAGTLITFIKTDANSNAITINPTDDFDSGSVNSVALGSQNESCTFIYDGSSWRLFTQDQTNSTAFAGGTVSSLTVTGATVLQGNVDVGNDAADTIGFFGATKVAQPADAAQAAVTITDVSSVNTDVDTNLDNLATLVNQLRADLISLGLIKGSA